MKLAIMQPYFFPYIGYFQLINSADIFVVYDNIKYIKGGWINRNRILQNGADILISLPIKRDSDSLDVCKRVLAGDFNRGKLLNKIKGAYNRAPYFVQTFQLVEKIVRCDDINLFNFLHNSITQICEHIRITTTIVKSSDINIDHSLKSQDRVLAICESVGAHTYINAIGGIELYSQEDFRQKNIDLKFIKSNFINYAQFKHEFCPWLSIIDVMMFNDMEVINQYLTLYSMV